LPGKNAIWVRGQRKDDLHPFYHGINCGSPARPSPRHAALQRLAADAVPALGARVVVPRAPRRGYLLPRWPVASPPKSAGEHSKR